MIYSSPLFVFFFLFCILVLYLLPASLRQAWLIISSIFWYATWGVYWALTLIIAVNFNYLFLRFIDSQKKEKRDYLFSLLVTLNALLFLVLKSGGFGEFQFESPYGSSFFIFIIVALVIDRWREKEGQPLYRWRDFILLPNFFPLLMGGPIKRGRAFFPQLHNHQGFKLENIVDGIIIFGLGFVRKEVLVLPLTKLELSMRTMGDDVYHYILIGFLETLIAYLQFTGYCEMGRGVARTMGIKLDLSFRPFYFSRNPNDFWQRWNISLGEWIRDYVSFPMMLKYGRKYGQSLILLFSFIMVGLWHGIEVDWLIFGVFNGVIIVSYNWISKHYKIPYAGRIFAFIIIIGNGLIQKDLMAIGENRVVFDSLWIETLSYMTPYFYFTLALIILLEIFQEWKKDYDWYLKYPLILKSMCSFILIVLFLWYVDMEMYAKESENLVPLYFKI